MNLRLQIKQVDYNYVEGKLCGEIPYIDYNNLDLQIYVDDQLITGTSNLAGGTFSPTVPPVITTTANGIDVTSVALESGNVVNVGIDLPNIWDKAKVRIVATKANYAVLDKTFTVYGYDLGNNPSVNNSLGNPVDYNYDVCFILTPDVVAVTPIFVNFQGLMTGQPNPYDFTITADNLLPIGSTIVFTGNGDSIDQQVATWNAANPNNTVTLSGAWEVGQPSGPVLVPVKFALDPGQTLTLTGETTDTIQNTFADFIGWRAPFTDCLRLYKNNPARYSNISYNNPDLVASTEDAVVSCTTGETFNQTVELIEYTGSSCPGMVVDTCTSADKSFPFNPYIPNFGFIVECQDGCCNTNCVVKTNDNVIKPSISYSALADIFVDDTVVAPFDTIDMTTKIIDCDGNIVFIDVRTLDTSLPLDISAVEIPFTIPSKGDYLISVVYENDAIRCEKTQVIKGCEQYHIIKEDCGKYKACVYKIGQAGTTETVTLAKMNDKKTFDTVETYEVAYCSCVDLDIKEDGVYSITFDNAGDAQTLIIIVDCNWKACALGFIGDIVCKDKGTCNCNDNSCDCKTKVPTNLYDFNAFMALTYGYLSLLNNEYLHNFIYSVLDPNKIDELYDIKMFLDRVVDYCKQCENNPTSGSSNCGCNA